MALGTISFQQYPVASSGKRPVITNWTPIVPYAVRQTDISGLFYFKFILEIRITDASGTLLGKIKQKKSPAVTGTTNVTAVFDVRDIVNTQLVDTIYDQNQSGVPFESIHTVGSNTGQTSKIFSESGNIQLGKTQLATIYVMMSISDSSRLNQTKNHYEHN